jgi:hypothetical protein
MKRHLWLAILTVASLNLASVLTSSTFSWADADPQPSPSAKLDMNFLLLPAYELEPAANPDPKVTQTPERRVGDEIVLHVADLAIPQGSSGPLKIELPPGTQPLNDEGWEIFTKSEGADLKLIAVPLKAGKLTLPSLAIQDAAGKSFARTNPFRVEVKSAIRPDDPKPQEPADLRPPAELAFPWWAIALMTIGALLVVGATGYSLYRWSKGKRAIPAKVVEPPKPEDEEALASLAQLEKSGALERGEFKKYYFGVSETLKRYIGRRYDFDAPENTTREMMENLRQAWARELGGEQKKLTELAELFEQLDRVKFTDHVPASIESQGIVHIAREFVRATRRRPMPVETSNGGGVNAVR